MITIKKYSNRRLYDTSQSRYITLEELAEKIKGGEDVQVIDAKSGNDLTQGTLTQIIMESRGAAKLLPVPLLTQLIRMENEALVEFFGKYMGAALNLYLQAQRRARAIAPYYPFANAPFLATEAMARFLGGGGPWARFGNGWGGHGAENAHPGYPPPSVSGQGWPSPPPEQGGWPQQAPEMAGGWPVPPMPQAPPAPPASEETPVNEIAALRKELEALKAALKPDVDES